MMEKRATKRWRSRLRRARLLDRSMRFLVDCRIVDLSPTGARLKPQSDRPLPLDLYLHDEDMDFSTPATLVWIRKGEIGLRYTPEPDAKE